jgi:hypothetical protein
MRYEVEGGMLWTTGVVAMERSCAVARGIDIGIYMYVAKAKANGCFKFSGR